MFELPILFLIIICVATFDVVFAFINAENFMAWEYNPLAKLIFVNFGIWGVACLKFMTLLISSSIIAKLCEINMNKAILTTRIVCAVYILVMLYYLLGYVF